jgi:hypothetical protein
LVDGLVLGLVFGDVLGLGDGDSARAAVPITPSVTTAAAEVAARVAMIRFRISASMCWFAERRLSKAHEGNMNTPSGLRRWGCAIPGRFMLASRDVVMVRLGPLQKGGST